MVKFVLRILVFMGCMFASLNGYADGGDFFETIDVARIVAREGATLDPHTWTRDTDGDWKIKPLAEAAYGADSVNLVHIPTDWQPEEIGAFDVTADSESPWLYVVNGDLKATVGETEIKLVQDDFLMWSADAPLLLPEDPLSDVGCIVLCSGHRLASSKV